MIKRLKRAGLLFSFLLTGCSGFNVEMQASTDVNQDINNEPSPIAISIFELSDPISFEGASFIDLYTEPQKVLGATMLNEKNIMLSPGQKLSIRLTAIKQAAYLGYVAAYRNFDSVTWQALVPVEMNKPLGQSFWVKVNAQGLEVQNQDGI